MKRPPISLLQRYRDVALDLLQLKKTLRRRTRALENSQRMRSRQQKDQRLALSDALKKADRNASLLAESRNLQQSLQGLTRGTLAAQETERATVSRRLNEDVAQPMLGIQVRLAHLKKEAARRTTGLRKEITSAQRLVEKSTKTLDRFAGRLRACDES